MINYKFVRTLVIACLIFFISGILIGKYKFSKQDIKVVEVTHSETKWDTKIETKIVYRDKKPEFNQDNFDIFYNCYKSPIQFKHTVNNNFLNVTAFDDCKEATAQYEIGTKGNWKMYLAFAGICAAAGGAALWYFTR